MRRSSGAAAGGAARAVRWRKFVKGGGVELLLLILGILILWSAISRIIPNPDRYLPSPLSVVLSSYDVIWKGLLPNYIGQTLWRLVVGSVIGLGLGIPFGIALPL